MKLSTLTSDSQRPRSKLVIRRDTILQLVPFASEATGDPCVGTGPTNQCTNMQSAHKMCCNTNYTPEPPSRECERPKEESP